VCVQELTVRGLFCVRQDRSRMYIFCARVKEVHIKEVSSAYYRVAKTHRIPYLERSFSAKVTYI